MFCSITFSNTTLTAQDIRFQAEKNTLLAV